MSKKLSTAFLVLAGALWGCLSIFVSALSDYGFDSKEIGFIRISLCTLMLLVIILIRDRSLLRVQLRDMWMFVGTGIISVTLFSYCYFTTVINVEAGIAASLLYTSPVFGVMLGRVLYREDVTPNKLVAIAFNIGGCVLAVTNGDLSGFHFSVWGVTSGVIAGFCGASLAVFSRIATKTVHPLAVTFWGLVFGGVVMAAIAAPWPDVAAAMSPQLLLLFFGFGLIPTAVAYVLYMQGLSMGLETSKVPVVMSFETVVTVLVGIGVYAEPAGAIKVLGIVLVLASILIMNTDFSKLRNSVFVGHVIESMTFKPNAWWTEKSQDMDLFKERTGIALEPTVQESPWYFVR